MQPSNNRRQPAKARAEALPQRLDAARESWRTLALLALLGLATLSVAGTTGALSQGHALRLATEWRL
ncbi:MAG TPA: hypothetical protein VHL98_22675 [Microvirga sp.]|jgi:hypothetical protein|nr:hypothetical protein [Microvirga sp.]